MLDGRFRVGAAYPQPHCRVGMCRAIHEIHKHLRGRRRDDELLRMLVSRM